MVSLACTRQSSMKLRRSNWNGARLCSLLRPSSFSMSVLTLLSLTPACNVSIHADCRLIRCTSEPASGRHVEARPVAFAHCAGRHVTVTCTLLGKLALRPSIAPLTNIKLPSAFVLGHAVHDQAEGVPSKQAYP